MVPDFRGGVTCTGPGQARAASSSVLRASQLWRQSSHCCCLPVFGVLDAIRHLCLDLTKIAHQLPAVDQFQFGPAAAVAESLTAAFGRIHLLPLAELSLGVKALANTLPLVCPWRRCRLANRGALAGCCIGWLRICTGMICPGHKLELIVPAVGKVLRLFGDGPDWTEPATGWVQRP